MDDRQRPRDEAAEPRPDDDGVALAERADHAGRRPRRGCAGRSRAAACRSRRSRAGPSRLPGSRRSARAGSWWRQAHQNCGKPCSSRTSGPSPADRDVEPRAVGGDHVVLPRPGDPGDRGVGRRLSAAASAHRRHPVGARALEERRGVLAGADRPLGRADLADGRLPTSTSSAATQEVDAGDDQEGPAGVQAESDQAVRRRDAQQDHREESEEAGGTEHRRRRRRRSWRRPGSRPWPARSRSGPVSTGRGWRWRTARRASARCCRAVRRWSRSWCAPVVTSGRAVGAVCPGAAGAVHVGDIRRGRRRGSPRRTAGRSARCRSRRATRAEQRGQRPTAARTAAVTRVVLGAAGAERQLADQQRDGEADAAEQGDGERRRPSPARG